VQDDRLERADPQELAKVAINPHGVIPRVNGSPFYGTRVPDLHLLRYSKYMDATGTHRLRGPEDVARYAALINGADPMEFGTHHFLTDGQRRVQYRYADEVLYAIGNYLLSLEPPKNPNPPPAELVARGKEIFRREKCGSCHSAPNYTTGELTPADGFEPPFDHPIFGDIRDRSVGTDPGLALKTRKGTGFYKIPSLRGLWYRPQLLHDASIASLEELFDAARLSPEYEPKGWNPPGVTTRAVRGLEFLTKLTPEEKTALIAFLRSL
jgi:mono/diheme cytochrome c family protein